MRVSGISTHSKSGHAVFPGNCARERAIPKLIQARLEDATGGHIGERHIALECQFNE